MEGQRLTGGLSRGMLQPAICLERERGNTVHKWSQRSFLHYDACIVVLLPVWLRPLRAHTFQVNDD
jgi:hypothetical protein